MHRTPQILYEEHPSQHTRINTCSNDEKCETSEANDSGSLLSGENDGSRSIAVHGLFSIFGSERVTWNYLFLPAFLLLQTCLISFHRLHQSPKPTIQISNKEEFNSIYESDCECAFSSEVPRQTCTLTRNRLPSQVIVPQGLLPSPAAHSSSFTSFLYDNPTVKFFNLLNHIGKFFFGPQNVSNSETRITELLGPTLIPRFSLTQNSLGLPQFLLRFFLSATLFPSISRNSTSQPGLASNAFEDDGLQNATQMDLMMHLVAESALYTYRLADDLLQGSAALMIVTASNGVDLRLVREEVLVSNQSPTYVTEGHHHYGDMWVDVDNMSYEELLALEDRIGNVSTGLSEDAALSSLEQSKYFEFAEENSQKEFCSICQEDYVEEDELGILHCGHSFHTTCITQWLGYKNVCPFCKSNGLFATDI